MTDIEATLKQIQADLASLKDKIEDIHLMFKPRPVVKRLTKKQKFNLDVQKMTAKMTADILAKGKTLNYGTR